LYSGKLHPRIAAGLAPPLNLQLRAIWTTDLEQRVAKLEKLLAKADEGLDGNPRAPELDFGDLPVPKVLNEASGGGFEGSHQASGFVDG